MSFEPDVNLLSAAMDRVIPAVDDLPGAGSMGLADEVVERSRTDDRFWSALQAVLEGLAGAEDFTSLGGDGQDDVLRGVDEQEDRRTHACFTL